MYICVRDIIVVFVQKPEKYAVMYICVRDITEVFVQSQRSKLSCIYVLGISLKCLYKAREVSCHGYMC